MSLDETLQRLQDAAWEHVASLSDTDSLSNDHLAGWLQVAQAAQPLLDALERPEVMQSLQHTAAAIPARPAQQATPNPHLQQIATALREVNDQLPTDTATRQNVSDVVALVIHSTARTDAAQARDSSNPQVRTTAAELEMTAQQSHEAVTDPQARAMPTPSAPASRQAPTARRTPEVSHDVQHDAPRQTPTQRPGRSM